MATLQGLEDAGRITGRLEKATQEFIDEFKDGRDESPMADFIYASMLTLAQNVDVQNMKGREISRNMTSLLGYIEQLKELYGDSDDGDDELASLVEDSKA
ncbi:hypothetical protein OZX72_02985 [Bifidobacterium sp. ESL0769]|uniref:hypothetical protein n=1 Tax=Bifidobacterium sp. ESL0769 TaxID=2983229 RepID=UPI0023F717F1|nr:hypothetical protein [Bifidobacterium sp. ESL0769]WEV67962.1 hypothetical protein OZX72_02985 [Bifidobacterium sp. ESL0769]